MTTYVDDVQMPGMLYIKVLHSPVHKGIIRRLDVSAADSMPGVAGVITAKDVPGENIYGAIDQPVFPEKDIRYKGERLAAVAAVDEDTAMEAIEKIKLDIEEQTPVFDPLEAMKPDAPKVRPEGNLWEFNSGKSRILRKGDVEKGFAEADEIVEQRYVEKMNDHAAMEPHATVAYIDGNDRLTIHTMSQARHFHLGQLCTIFNLPISKVKLIGGTVGGAFGGKAEVEVDHVSGLMALKIRKPVKYCMTRKEDLLYSYKRGAFIFEYKSGVKRDGRVTAHKIRAIHDIGAYQTLGAYAIDKQCLYIAGPYAVPNVWYDGYAVYTNKPVASCMRGFAMINVTYTSETQMNLLAEAIGMDPWEIRFINAWRDGDTAPTQWKVVAAGLIETMQKAAEMEGIELPAHLKTMSSRRR
jgi:CO/xanthine dehydrogenase Mo-binding subunit